MLVSLRRQSSKKRSHVIQLVLLILGVGIGIGLGIGLQSKNLSSDKLRLIGLPGEVFMRCLMLIAMPLIVSSLITAFAELRDFKAGKILLRVFLYYAGTTILSTVTGVIFCAIIRPGVGLNDGQNVFEKLKTAPLFSDTFSDVVRNLFPDNIVKATLSKTITKKINTSTLNGTYRIESSNVDNSGTNYLGLVAFSIICGIITGQIGKDGDIIIKLNKSIFKISIKMIHLLMWYAPIGILFLIASSIANISNIELIFLRVGMFVATLALAEFAHGLLTLPTIYYIFIRKNPFKYYFGMIPALLTVFGTDSSSATLPVTIRCVEETNKINAKISRLVLTIGSTINMDGTAMYEAMAPMFLYQLHGYQLDAGTLFTVCAMGVAASVGAAGVPGSGIVFLTIVLQACGLPPEDIFLFLPLDNILSRFRGIVNICGDSVGAAVIDHLSRNDKNSNDGDDVDEKSNDVMITGEIIEINNELRVL